MFESIIYAHIDVVIASSLKPLDVCGPIIVPLVAFYPTPHLMSSPLVHSIAQSYTTPPKSSRPPVIVVTVLAIVVAVVTGFVHQVPSRCEMASDLESQVISQVIDTLG